MRPCSSVHKMYGTGKPIAVANEFRDYCIKPSKLQIMLLVRYHWPIRDSIIKPSSYSKQNVYTTRRFNEFLC